MSFRRVDAGTEVTYSAEFTFEGPARFLAPVVQARARAARPAGAGRDERGAQQALADTRSEGRDVVEWTGQVYADSPTVAVQTRIQAPPERVWGLATDIHLMPRLSTELREVEWLGGATGPALGHRFSGRNAHPSLGEWETVSTVVECDEPCRFAWAVGDPSQPSSTWRFTLRPDGAGTMLEQWAQLGPARSGLSRAIDAMPDKEQKIVFVRLRTFEAGLTRNLAAIKELAERTP